MNQAGFEIVLATLVLISRLGDILSTRFATPTLVVEANPLVRRLGWPFAAATCLLALVPFYNTAAGVLILVPSLLVSASNLGKAWVIRAIGEEQYFQILRTAALRFPQWGAHASVAGSAAFVGLAGLVLWYLSGSTVQSWPGIFAIGILVYAGAILLHGSLFVIRLYRSASKAAAGVAAV